MEGAAPKYVCPPETMLVDPVAAKKALLHTFPETKVLVVGDIMLDKYIWGGCSRISPEAPVPIVHARHHTAALGGAANVAVNLASLGVQTSIAGFVGDDPDGVLTRQTCQDCGIDATGIVDLDDYPTTTKTRIIADNHQMMRVDEEDARSKSDTDADRLLTQVSDKLKEVSAVILSDYAKGVTTPYFCQALIQACTKAGVPVFVDPKGRDYEKYRGATAIKPNRLELSQIDEACGWHSPDPVTSAARLRDHLGLSFVAVTLGAKGIAVVSEDGTHELPTMAKDVFDVSGAGDTVGATMVAALASGLPLTEAVTLANLAAAEVVAKAGTVAITRDALLLAIQGQAHHGGARKLYDISDLQDVTAAWRASGLKVAFTNGCFDLLHAGHVRLLEDSAKTADRLVVAINSDASVTRLKGAGRPLNVAEMRAAVLSALESVDAVIVFEEDTPEVVIHALRPDILIKGGDYTKETVVGASFVESYGGEVKLIPLVKGLSTTNLARAIESL